jgi:uncharacterized protein
MKKGRCPTCKKEFNSTDSFPFCSERCQLIDLWNWFNDEYKISEPIPNVEEIPEKSDLFWRN